MAAFYNTPFYFKHLLENDNVVESYLEFVITPEMAAEDENLNPGTYSLKGGVNESELSNKPVFNANINVLKQAFGEGSNNGCTGFDDSSDVGCYSNLSIMVSSDGTVALYTYVAGDINEVVFCSVDYDGDSRCTA